VATIKRHTSDHKLHTEVSFQLFYSLSIMFLCKNSLKKALVLLFSKASIAYAVPEIRFRNWLDIFGRLLLFYWTINGFPLKMYSKFVQTK